MTTDCLYLWTNYPFRGFRPIWRYFYEWCGRQDLNLYPNFFNFVRCYLTYNTIRISQPCIFIISYSVEFVKRFSTLFQNYFLRGWVRQPLVSFNLRLLRCLRQSLPYLLRKLFLTFPNKFQVRRGYYPSRREYRQPHS